VEGLPPAPQVELVIDREKAAAFGVTFQDVNSTISTNLGSSYINDFPNRGRMQRVIVQADQTARMQASDLLAFNVRNSQGRLVPFSSFATVKWSVGVRDAITRTIVTLPEELRRSLTWDQGAEMAQHARLKIDAGVLRSAKPVAAWHQREHQRTAASVLPERHRSECAQR
jgi:AcrB/AcrD/AcrF family